MTYRGEVRNGMVVLDGPARLPEGAHVEVTLLPRSAAITEEEQVPTLYERLRSVIGIAEGLPSDLAENHDHYAHGRPKR